MGDEERDLYDLAGRMLKKARLRGGWSQERFAELIGEKLGIKCDRQRIRRYEADEHQSPARPVPGMFLLAAKELTGLSLDELFEEVDAHWQRAELARLTKMVEDLQRREHRSRGK